MEPRVLERGSLLEKSDQYLNESAPVHRILYIYGMYTSHQAIKTFRLSVNKLKGSQKKEIGGPKKV